jgi:hypothetical protein
LWVLKYDQMKHDVDEDGGLINVKTHMFNTHTLTFLKNDAKSLEVDLNFGAFKLEGQCGAGVETLKQDVKTIPFNFLTLDTTVNAALEYKFGYE